MTATDRPRAPREPFGHEELLASRVFRVERVRFVDGAGREVVREVVRHPGAVTVVPGGVTTMLVATDDGVGASGNAARPLRGTPAIVVNAPPTTNCAVPPDASTARAFTVPLGSGFQGSRAFERRSMAASPRRRRPPTWVNEPPAYSTPP